MKKAILWIVAIVVCVWAPFWIGSSLMIRAYASKEWPAGLGRAD